jgi:hypothetical protein
MYDDQITYHAEWEWANGSVESTNVPNTMDYVLGGIYLGFSWQQYPNEATWHNSNLDSIFVAFDRIPLGMVTVSYKALLWWRRY